LRLIVSFRGCGHQIEPDLGQLAERDGADTRVLDWRERASLSECGGRDVDLVVSGTEGESERKTYLRPKEPSATS
jgi:hypothetical protein